MASDFIDKQKIEHFPVVGNRNRTHDAGYRFKFLHVVSEGCEKPLNLTGDIPPGRHQHAYAAASTRIVCNRLDFRL